MTIKQSNITTKERKNQTSHTSMKPNIKEAENTRTKTSNYTKNQLRPTMLHNMENIIHTVTCTPNQSMAHHEQTIQIPVGLQVH